MLGIPYTTAIDMWSTGCIIYECLVGVPIFAGENERDQMAAIIEVIGVPPRSLIAVSILLLISVESNEAQGVLR